MARRVGLAHAREEDEEREKDRNDFWKVVVVFHFFAFYPCLIDCYCCFNRPRGALGKRLFIASTTDYARR